MATKEASSYVAAVKSIMALPTAEKEHGAAICLRGLAALA